MPGPESGGLGGLADAKQPGLEGHAGDGDDGNQPGWVGADPTRPAAPRGAIGRLGNAESDDQRRQRESGAGDRRDGPVRGSGFWDDFDWLPCRDGKWRRAPRAESGIFPLAYGFPRGMVHGRDSGVPLNPQATGEGRIMRLQGYGNAINAVLAAAFIETVMELLP